MSGATLLAISYGLLAVSAVAFLLRTMRLWRLPVHLRWELAPVPKEKTRGKYGGSYLEEPEWWHRPREESVVSEGTYMAKEILLLKALWEHNKGLWVFSFPFHLGLYVLVAAAALGMFASVIAAAGVAGPGWGVVGTVLPALAGAGYAMGLLGAVGLLASRLLSRDLKQSTTPVTIFNLLLLLAMFATGVIAIAAGGFAPQAVEYGRSLLTASAPETVPGPMAAHVVATLCFLVCLPFGPMMHFVAKYFTYHQVRWDDRPMVAGGDLEAEVLAELGQAPTWGAAHVGADGKKNWVDVVTGGGRVMQRDVTIKDIGRREGEVLSPLRPEELIPLPPPYDKLENLPEWKELAENAGERMVCNLDGVVGLSLPHPKDEAEEKEYVDRFAAGLAKLLERNNNWTFLQPLTLSLEYCVGCQTCADACHVYLASGKKDIYRPTYRSDVWRQLVKKYVKPGGKLLAKFTGNDIDLNWTTITRLYELAYRCNLCRRCAQTCPIGVDNGLITHEIRKLFSQELGWAPKELHEKGTVLQMDVGSSTGMNKVVVKDNIDFIDEDMADVTGFNADSPWDEEGADVLLLHNAGEILAWPENPGAFAILLNAAGIKWTLSSDDVAFDGVNYGLFYDDVQLARIALRHAETARKLKVRRIVAGECGHEHKALITIADRVLTGEMSVPRESFLPLIETIVFSGKIEFDPSKNDFPVTLHDPCNMVRNLGLVEPQRRILRYLCPQFREMTPHGVDNYCCGGGSGFAVMSPNNFTEWRVDVAGRMKFKQILDAFEDQPGPEVQKYVCAPCSNCKGQIRDMLQRYGALERSGITYGGLVELIVNAMVGIKEPFITWEMH